MKINSARVWLGAIILLPLSVYAQPEVKTFKDWVVGCNNVRGCEAVSLTEPDFGNTDAESHSAYLKVTRGGQPDAGVEFSVSQGWASEVPEDAVGQAVKISADRQVLALGELTAEQRDGMIKIPQDKTDSFLAMVRKPNVLTLTIGDQQYTASLRGLSATLLYMDEQQQRLDTKTALVRVGDKAMTAKSVDKPVVKAKLAPEKMAAPADLAQTIRAAAKADLKEVCEGEDPITDMDFAEPLDGDHYLVGLTCWLAAYNSSSVLFKVKADTAGSDKPAYDMLTLDTAPFGEASKEVSGANYDRATGSLTSYSKGRGLGDCGVSSAWAWTGEQFTMTRYDEMPECRGVPEFINLWTTAVK